jgi:ABC-type polysaccharide/polyol phosphate transport system ATPase subunit
MKGEIVIQAEDIVLDFPLRQNGPAFLKEIFTGRFRRRKGEKTHFRALEGVSLKARRGEVIGIMGPNGAGKSTLLRVIAGIYAPDSGMVQTKGRVTLLATLGAGFQKDLTGIENCYLNGAILGFSRKEVDVILPDIISFSGIGDFIHQPIRTYSSGMKARLAFSIASNMEPELLLIDEILAVGDSDFVQRSQDRIREMVNGDATVIIVSHRAATLRNLCDRVFCMHRGKMVTDGADPEVTFEAYKNYSARNNEES